MTNFKLAERLKQVRQLKGLTQTGLSVKSGVSRTMIAKYESKKIRVNQELLKRMESICKALDITLSDFFLKN